MTNLGGKNHNPTEKMENHELMNGDIMDIEPTESQREELVLLERVEKLNEELLNRLFTDNGSYGQWIENLSGAPEGSSFTNPKTMDLKEWVWFWIAEKKVSEIWMVPNKPKFLKFDLPCGIKGFLNGFDCFHTREKPCIFVPINAKDTEDTRAVSCYKHACLCHYLNRECHCAPTKSLYLKLLPKTDTNNKTVEECFKQNFVNYGNLIRTEQQKLILCKACLRLRNNCACPPSRFDTGGAMEFCPRCLVIHKPFCKDDNDEESQPGGSRSASFGFLASSLLGPLGSSSSTSSNVVTTQTVNGSKTGLTLTVASATALENPEAEDDDDYNCLMQALALSRSSQTINMSTDKAQSFVRVFSQDGQISGVVGVTLESDGVIFGLTCAHVVGDSVEVYIDNAPVSGKVAYNNYRYNDIDVSFISQAEQGMQHLYKWDFKKVHKAAVIGAKVRKVQLSIDDTESTAIVLKVCKHGLIVEALDDKEFAAKGESGAPVFDMDGEFVGIVVGLIGKYIFVEDAYSMQQVFTQWLSEIRGSTEAESVVRVENDWLKKTWRTFSSFCWNTIDHVKNKTVQYIPPFNYRKVWNDIDRKIADENSHLLEPLDSSKTSRLRGVRLERGLRVIVVDGGGSLGVVPATILLEIERQIAKIQEEKVNADKANKSEEKLNDQPEEQLNDQTRPTVPNWKEARHKNAKYDDKVFLADHVDMFCGTSAGGMISLAHAHGRLKVRVIQDLFLSGAAFTKWHPRLPFVMDYPVNRLEKAMDNVYKKLVDPKNKETCRLDRGETGKALRAIARTDRNDDTRAAVTRPYVFAVTNPHKSLDTVLLTNFHQDEYVRSATLHQEALPITKGDISPTDATRATSAAPYYYPPKLLPETMKEEKTYQRYYLDGGLVNNSPVDLGVTQTQMLFGPKREFQLVVSIGCGTTIEDQENRESGGSTYWRSSLFFRLVKSYLVNSTAGFERAQRMLYLDPRFKQMAYGGVFRLNPVLSTKHRASIDCSDPNILEDIADEVAYQCQVGGSLHEEIVAIARILADVDGVKQRDEWLDVKRNDFQDLRARAEAVVKLHPPPISGNDKPLKLSPKEWKQLYQSDQNDVGSFNERRNFIHLVNFLENCLKEMLPPNEWLESMLDRPSSLAQSVEDARAVMNRNFITPFGKSIGKLDDEKCKEIIHAFSAKELLRIITVQVEYDRVNALQFLQYNRGSGPRGKFWGTKAVWEKFTKAFANEIAESVEFRCNWSKERPTVSQNVVLLVKVLEYCKNNMNDQYQHLDEPSVAQFEKVQRMVLDYQIPEWIVKKYPGKVEEFQKDN